MRLIDDEPRPGAHGSLVAFIHPSSAHGVLVELKQAAAKRDEDLRLHADGSGVGRCGSAPWSSSLCTTAASASTAARCSAWCPKPLWERRAPADDRNRIRLAMRPLLVRGERTMIVDAGIGDKMDAKGVEIYAIDRTPIAEPRACADAG